MMKAYQRQKIINDFGEKIDMKSNWIETTEYHPSCGHRHESRAYFKKFFGLHK